MLFQVSLLPEHSHPRCAMEAFTRDSAGQQFDRAPARCQDLKQRQHLHGKPSLLLPKLAHFQGPPIRCNRASPPTLISCVYVQTLTTLAINMTAGQRQQHGGGAHPQAVELTTLPRWPEKTRERSRTCDPALLRGRQSCDGRRRQPRFALTRSSLYFGLLDSSFVRLKKAERELGEGGIAEI